MIRDEKLLMDIIQAEQAKLGMKTGGQQGDQKISLRNNSVDWADR